MLGHQRSLAAIIASALVAATLMFAAPSTTAAAPYVKAPELSVSTTSPCVNSTLTVTGRGFVPGSTVKLTLRSHGRSISLGKVVVDANGNFSTTVRLPAGVSGTFHLVAAGARTAENPNKAQSTLHIRVCVSPSASAVAPPPPGAAAPPAAAQPAPPPAFTGVEIFGIVALAVALLGIGGGFVYVGRRRKSAA